ncbi:YciI family protein [Bradyrhizobium sp. 180]|uniref:YciI family protein n=1 Tax=unclassified Bradyrhizobium TaxID=2631580 RepID=UPI001FF803AF|nr:MULTISPECIES: YciI family protein [unclassified Bradyrhizobium]MCK1423865.1 YciI family protein [Bradyrhizobium sp. CW12]MCK1495359.1 YciI family protein [Bradyrhizobium sp. 180]MCK1526393.1 YciI family protein [Bradyrhizobium sp. 182]MCK1597517.1 YciI family protein [Bradyrhizobium sp. 164]MCK1616282.1 YciI family protein [Bradyrhizobium sp. 159]
MRFMVIVKANQDTEAGKMPSTEMLAAMGRFNEEMAKAGVIEAGEGLHPTVKGARVRYSARSEASVTRGPFDLSPDLIAGFWLIKTASLDEAIAWMKRAPFDSGSEIEIRQVFSADDFGEAFTPELREQEERTRAHAAKK